MEASFFFCAACSLNCNFPYKFFINLTIMHGQLGGLGGIAENSHSASVKRGLP